MKKILSLFTFALLLMSCGTSKDFTDYELSYSRSGGLSPVYENFVISGNNAKFYYEGRAQKYSTQTRISAREKAALYSILEDSRIAFIREDHRKIYDGITTTVKVKKDQIIKSDGSGIMPQDAARWENIVNAFENLITKNNLRK